MIRLATQDDFDYIYGLYMHPQVNPFLLYEMMEPCAFRPIYDDLLSKGVKYVFEVDGNPVGMCKLVPLQHRNAHIVYLGGVAIDPVYAGKGYGLTLMQEVIAFAQHRGFLRIELSVATINEKAIRLYEKAGFEQEGVFRKFSFLRSENRFLDEAVMSFLIP